MTHALQVLHTLQWHHPGGRALGQLAQAPTQDYHSYTHTLHYFSIFRRFARSRSCAPPFYAYEFLDLKNPEMTIISIKMCF